MRIKDRLSFLLAVLMLAVGLLELTPWSKGHSTFQDPLHWPVLLFAMIFGFLRAFTGYESGPNSLGRFLDVMRVIFVSLFGFTMILGAADSDLRFYFRPATVLLFVIFILATRRWRRKSPKPLPPAE